MLNKAILMGRLTKDPELRRTQSGLSVTSFTLAIDRDFGGKGEEKQTDFIDIVCWRNTADFTAKWFHKGQLVAVAGRIQQRKWQDKEGNNRYSFEVIADEAHFAERRSDSPTAEKYDVPPRTEPSMSAPAMNAPSTFAELDEDDGELPF